MNYGKSSIDFDIPDRNIISTLIPQELPPIKNVSETIVEALRKPVDAKPLKDIVDKTTNVALLISDITRPCPSHKILLPLLTELNKSGVSDHHITIYFATGMHRRHTLEEKKKLVGTDIFNRIKTIDHDSHDSKNHHFLGKTKRGTEIFLNKQVLSNDLLIGIANIDIHYFAGYSGGAKSLLPGVASFQSIQQNHSLMLLQGSEPGRADGNPVREDLEEASQMANFNFIVNVALNENKEIVKVVAGHYIKAHRSGAEANDYMYKRHIKERADIVLATTGGFPKDINLYQSQKALDNAAYAVKAGGTIILLAECVEGMGEKTFSQWLQEASCPDDVIERLKKGFVLGGHKAFAIAKIAKTNEIILVSSLPEELVKKSFMKPAKTVEDALAQAFVTQGKDATVTLMPYAGSTYPSLF
jgi:nickel-dependent lactate racemase